MKKRIFCLLIGVCCLFMLVACGAKSGANSNGNTETQSGANSNDNTENQNAEVDLLKKVEMANKEDALLAKYGKVAYRHVYTYGDGHSESSYRYLDADRYVVEELERDYPQYQFAKHKGYGTKLHYEMLDQFGPCAAHRKTFLKKWAEKKA